MECFDVALLLLLARRVSTLLVFVTCVVVLGALDTEINAAPAPTRPPHPPSLHSPQGGPPLLLQWG